MPFELGGWLLLGAIGRALHKHKQDVDGARAWMRDQERRLKKQGKLSSRVSFPRATAEKLQLASGSMSAPRCAYERLGNCRGPLQIDHRRPLAAGGSNRAKNLQYVCEYHNKAKGRKSERAFVAAQQKELRRQTGERVAALKTWLLGPQESGTQGVSRRQQASRRRVATH